MATIPFQNFALTDPVAAQQAVQMAQILQAAQAEKDRNMGLFARGVQQQQTARENAAEQRALTQAQMNQQSSELEKQRQARALETDKLIAAQKSNLTSQGLTAVEAEAYDNVAARIASEDPPTDSEFERLSSGISPERKARLRDQLNSQRRTLLGVADEAKQRADFWNRRFDAIRVGDDAGFKALREEFSKDRRSNDLLVQDPAWTGFRLLPKYKGPRMDPTPVSVTPMPALGNVPNPAAFRVPGDAAPTPISDILNNIQTHHPIGMVPVTPVQTSGSAVPWRPGLDVPPAQRPMTARPPMPEIPEREFMTTDFAPYRPPPRIPSNEFMTTDFGPYNPPSAPLTTGLYDPNAYSSLIGPRVPPDSAYAFPVPPLPRQPRPMWNPNQLGFIPVPNQVPSPDLYDPNAYMDAVGPRVPFVPIPAPSLSGSLSGYPASFLR